jgi:drug/metabolite transporter (DMT)-like permease
VTFPAIALILAAAVAHASWNYFSKQAAAAGAACFIWLLTAGSTVCYTPVIVIAALAGHPRLTGVNWLFLIGTGAIQLLYFLFLQLGYTLGDLSVVYPVGRGTGAMLAAIGGIVILGERPGPAGVAGIAAIVAGVIAIGIPAREERVPDKAPPTRTAVAFALAAGAFIAWYTVWDKYAVSNLRTPPILQGFACFPVIAAAFTPYVSRHWQRTAQVWREYRAQVIGAALLCPLSYMLVLVALSFTAVSAIAPAREVSVLFGVLLGRRLLGEGHLGRRLTAAAAIVAGVIAIAAG